MSPERLFDAWLDPDTARKWLFTTPTGHAQRREIDARVGGSYLFTNTCDGVEYKAIGEYLEINRPDRLVFTFAMPQFSPDSDRIIVDIASDGAGSVVTLTQEGLPPDYNSETEKGWGQMFDALAAALA